MSSVVSNADRALASKAWALGIYRWLLFVAAALAGMSAFPSAALFVGLTLLLFSNGLAILMVGVIAAARDAEKRADTAQLATEYAMTQYFRRLTAGVGDDLDEIGNTRVWADAHDYANRQRIAAVAREAAERDLSSGWWGRLFRPRTWATLVGFIFADLLTLVVLMALTSGV